MKAKQFWAKILVTLGALVVLLGTTALPANASPSSISPPAVARVMVPMASGSVCSSTGAKGSETSNLLPINRWSDASSDMFSALLSQHHAQNMQDQVSRETIVGGMLQIGNTMFKSATEFVTFSANFCFLDKAGGTIDSIVGAVGKKLFSSEFMAFYIVVILAYVIWASRRTGSIDFKTLFTKLAVIALLLFMSISSTMSTGGGIGKGTDAGSGYKPATGSFGWVMVTGKNTLGSIISGPAGMFEKGINGEKDLFGQTSGNASNNTNPLSCDVYVKSMRKEFNGNYPQNVFGMNAGMPLMMDSMWQDMGLRAYRTASFGYNLPNPENADIAYDDQTWCRLLEWNAGIPGTVGYDSAKPFNENTSGMSQGSNPVPLNSGDLENGLSQRHVLWKAGLDDSLPSAPGIKVGDDTIGKSEGDERWPTAWQGTAFNPGTTNEWQRSLIAWSACNLRDGEPAGLKDSWEIRGDFNQVFDEKYREHCASWFRGEDEAKKFEFPTTKGEIDGKIAKAGGNPALSKYIATLNGNDNQQSMASAGVYMISAGVLSIVFFLFGGINLVANIALGFLIFALFVGAILFIAPKAVPKGLGKTLKMSLSAILLTALFGFLFSLVALLSRLFQNLGSSLLERGSIMHLLWMGLSPVFAIIGLHLIFWLCKIPSPFTPKGAGQWATAGGAGILGGAVGAGLTQMRHGGRHMLSRSDRRALGGRARRTSPLQKFRHRSSRSVNAPGQVGADGVNRRLFAKKPVASSASSTASTVSQGDSNASSDTQKFSAREQLTHRAPSANNKALKEKARTGKFTQSDLRNSGEDTFKAGRGILSRFDDNDTSTRAERQNVRKQARTERINAFEVAKQDPDLPGDERKALDKQSQSFAHLGMRGGTKEVGRKVRNGAVATFGAVRRTPETLRSKKAWANGAKKVGSVSKRGFSKAKLKTAQTVDRKINNFKADPLGSTKRGTVALGRVAKTTAKYSALGAGLTVASALTGGVAAPILLGGVIAGRQVVKRAPGVARKRAERRTAQRNTVRKHVAQYRSAHAVTSDDMTPQRAPHGSPSNTNVRQEKSKPDAVRKPVLSDNARRTKPAVDARRRASTQRRRAQPLRGDAPRQLGSLRHAQRPRNIVGG
ncbi:hypothetical protein [Glutamicibacter ardleyensis]|uniref:hypothetical protein n=1 Tax=Glutamicibacter ardleyensis TaxID=225894 RepID=UPI003FD03AA3